MMKKSVNGVDVEMTPAEEAAFVAEQAAAAEDAAIPKVPMQVTMRQARLALKNAGKLALVGPAIAALPQSQREAAEIEWEFSSVVERNRPFVVSLGTILGLDGAAMDALFISAEKL